MGWLIERRKGVRKGEKKIHWPRDSCGWDITHLKDSMTFLKFDTRRITGPQAGRTGSEQGWKEEWTIGIGPFLQPALGKAFQGVLGEEKCKTGAPKSQLNGNWGVFIGLSGEKSRRNPYDLTTLRERNKRGGGEKIAEDKKKPAEEKMEKRPGSAHRP